MNTVVISGFLNLNKVRLDKGFKEIFGIGLKQGVQMTEHLLANGSLELNNLSDKQVQELVELAKSAHANIEVL